MRQMTAAVDVYWLPLGAGGRFVRLNGRIYEALTARLHRRPRRDLYHSALEVRLGRERYVIEMAPVWNERASDRGVVAEGRVGSRLAGHLRLFRYELRCWRDGRVPDAAEAVESPRELTRGTRRSRMLSWSSYRRSPPSSGAVTSSSSATCGTRTRRSHG